MLFGEVLPLWLRSYQSAEGANSRRCIYTVLVTFWGFLSQVLDPDGSCRRAVTRIRTLRSVLHLPLPRDDTAADCIARARRPMRVLVRVARGMIERLTGRSPEGRRLVVMDGTRVTLPDRPKNAAANSYAPGQKPGCGFPVMALLGLFDLTTGA